MTARTSQRRRPSRLIKYQKMLLTSVSERQPTLHIPSCSTTSAELSESATVTQYNSPAPATRDIPYSDEDGDGCGTLPITRCSKKRRASSAVATHEAEPRSHHPSTCAPCPRLGCGSPKSLMAEYLRRLDLLRLDRLLSMQRYVPRMSPRPVHGHAQQGLLISTTMTDAERDVVSSLAFSEQEDEQYCDAHGVMAQDEDEDRPSPMGFTVSVHDSSDTDSEYEY